jgi:HAD superfamily hydrolase (TIGR01509 family)
MMWLYARLMNAFQVAALLAPALAAVVAFRASLPGGDWSRYTVLVLAAVLFVLQVFWARLITANQAYVSDLWPDIRGWMRKLRRRSPKALLLDLDGVLIDTVPLHAEAYDRTALAHDLLLTDDELEAQRGMPPREFFTRVLRDRGLRGDKVKVLAEELSKEKERIATQLTSLQPPQACAGARKLIDKAMEKRIQIAVVSSASRENLKRYLEDADYRHGMVLVSGDDVERGKPDPEPYETAAKRLNVDPKNCDAVEDAEAGVLSATKAGAYCIAIGDPGEHRLREAKEVVSDLYQLARRLGWRIDRAGQT